MFNYLILFFFLLQSLNEKERELTVKLQQVENKNTDINDENDRLKKHLIKLTTDEVELRRTVDQNSPIISDTRC
ncbi:hypothetical protein IHO40_04475 [Wolbachia endosymbiont of Mansonella ozzardi]|nr:hypothetical protein [Wolbachia endosymbiont of Mansonella ozzardi]